ncbi:methyltransferase domain-containing protein [Chitinophaga silvatica]|uniref:tRNA1(Val) (adenine(37)-N6)-methyltransferase n=1 Tax=Chitinophaga silvatica TaxID=2282649 RepID=A0A3E1YHG8_9BACT|nr:methyltransferase [Chitinophaga silvatica]RFS26873.1 methyltransferase domain-containing protein [Chitinophaga silvatica]
MANTFFQFKQFTVHQALCAMKVCTDACIQGAYTARYLNQNNLSVPAILDLGAGTGLLSLLLAQQTTSDITAVELDPGAARQATENFALSPWSDRLQLMQTDIRKLEASSTYNFIITNPPFYEDALKSGQAEKDQAMHATNLSYNELLRAINSLLAADGEISVLLPYQAFNSFMTLALQSNLFLKQRLDIRQTTSHSYFRTVGIFSRVATGTAVEELSIHDTSRNYTPEFIELLKPYYLYL